MDYIYKVKSMLRIIPDKPFLVMMYFFRTKKFLHLKNPRTFNEKLQWLKLYNKKNKNPLYIQMVDKKTAKDYVAKMIGQEYIIPTISDGYERFEDIPFDELPHQFVLKCNHDSGGLVICTNKKAFNFKEASKKINRCLKRNFYWHGREWPYKHIKPSIIVEQYMVDESGIELKDYKFFCFNGKVKCFKVDFNRFTKHQANYYDLELNLLPFGETSMPPDPSRHIQMPDNLNQMISLAEKLAEDIPFVRIDFYNIKGKIYFGEMTLCPGAGCNSFTNEEWEYRLGEWLTLPN